MYLTGVGRRRRKQDKVKDCEMKVVIIGPKTNGA
jgi:hypothetical protein